MNKLEQSLDILLAYHKTNAECEQKRTSKAKAWAILTAKKRTKELS